MPKTTLLTVVLCAVVGTSSSWGFDVTDYRLVDLTCLLRKAMLMIVIEIF
jgi:hypothetical protein